MAKFWLYQHSGVLLTILVFGTLSVLLAFPDANRGLVITAVGLVLSLAYFLQKQKLDEIKLFKELFVEFNERYERLSAALDEVRRAATLTDAHKKTLTSYFNLCSEEYLFNCRGYIHPDAWQAWRQGMREVFAVDGIHAFWLDEKKSGSYYGFEREVSSLLEP